MKCNFSHKNQYETAADPGFPVLGGADLRRGCSSLEMYAKTEELGPVGGGAVLVNAPQIRHCEKCSQIKQDPLLYVKMLHRELCFGCRDIWSIHGKKQAQNAVRLR